MEVLHLQNNQIAVLPDKVFIDLGNLTQLVLTGNSIISIPPGLFSKYYQIQTLSFKIIHNDDLNEICFYIKFAKFARIAHGR